MFKKLLIATLTCLSFVSLTACGSGKKLTEDEAKAEIKAAQENTAKAIKERKGLTVKQTYNAKADINAKNVKIGEGVLAFEVKSAKFGYTTDESLEANVDLIDKEAKLKGDIKANIHYELNANSETQKKDYNASASGELYYKNSKKEENKSNIYAKGTATLPEKDDLEEILSFFELLNYDTEDFMEMIENLQTSYEGKINIGIDSGEDSESIDYIEYISKYDFSTLIKDWSIFTKKGSTLSANCSNIEALDLGIDNEDVEELATYGIKLEISKFDIKLGKNGEITNIDFKLSLNGKLDLAKVAEATSDEMTVSAFENMSGTVNADATIGFGINISYLDAAPAVLVPDELLKLEETSLEDLYAMLINGGEPDTKKLERKVRNVYVTAQQLLLEASSVGVATYLKFDINTMTYTVTVKDMVAYGELLENPFDPNDFEDGGMTVSYKQYEGFKATIQGTINGYHFTIDEDGNIEVYQAK